ncbi:MAG: recombinase family protein [Acidobacteriaceae bacterium]|nr:recombinase family protein [Acidobacteriaceae bacterium]
MAEKQASKPAKAARVFGQGQRVEKPPRVSLYARVSTHDQQTLPLQLDSMRSYADQRGWTIVSEMQDVGSGSVQRPKRELLMKAARRRETDIILVWRLDRWGRSVADLAISLKELNELGVAFVSLSEALDLTTPSGRAMAGLLSVFAEFEREVLRERILAGIAQARKKGTRLGRPRTVSSKSKEVHELFAQGISKSEIARCLFISRTSVGSVAKILFAFFPRRSVLLEGPSIGEFRGNKGCLLCFRMDFRNTTQRGRTRDSLRFQYKKPRSLPLSGAFAAQGRNYHRLCGPATPSVRSTRTEKLVIAPARREIAPLAPTQQVQGRAGPLGSGPLLAHFLFALADGQTRAGAVVGPDFGQEVLVLIAMEDQLGLALSSQRPAKAQKQRATAFASSNGGRCPSVRFRQGVRAGGTGLFADVEGKRNLTGQFVRLRERGSGSQQARKTTGCK